MIIGISFKLENEWGFTLERLLQAFDITRYNVLMKNDEIYAPEGPSIDIAGIYNGATLMELLPKEKNYCIAASILAFEGEPHNIQLYDEFKNSDCKFIIFIDDVVDVWVYIKDPDLLKRTTEIVEQRYGSYEYVHDTDLNEKRRLLW